MDEALEVVQFPSPGVCSGLPAREPVVLVLRANPISALVDQ